MARMNLAEIKALVALLFWLVRFSFGILPIKIYTYFLIVDEKEDEATFINAKREGQIMCFLAMFQSFSGGVLFATCFIHMMHELYFALTAILEEANMSVRYPYSQLIVSFGFFLVYFMEETAQWLISRIPDKPQSIKGPSNGKVHPLEEDKVTVIEDLMNQNAPNKKMAFDELSGPEEDTKTINSKIEEADYAALPLQIGKSVNQISQLEGFIEEPNKSQKQLFRGLLIIFALSLHSFFEGLAIGIQTSISNIIYLFIAISIHSATVLFCISLEFLMAKKRCKTIFHYVGILSISSPIGVFFGLLLSLNADEFGASRSHSVAVVVLEGISTGTILYIIFFEVLNREKERGVYRMRRAFCILFGFALMAVLEIFEL